MKVEFAEDIKHVKIQLNDTYSAEELEELIGGLAELRSAMEPSVPMRSPLTAEAPFTPFAIEDDPTFDLAKSKKTGVVRLLMRSSGMGWTAYDINPLNASTMAAWFRDNVVAVSALEESNIDTQPQ
ncbi:hypothetical protein [Comamonas sp. AG1104]|uniref:hypothetical protein n=1 Tax=Comamonas sp. AG1104 TaxID=2183900 RepID=UPI000E0AE78A|nr:hypothetical protein [Comamonas sp. AG1104]RDI10585.1 hypothetical protein DFO48_10595 [Comamonas sp. AG1104]